MSLAFDELSWDYTPAPAMDPGAMDTFWLEFDAPGSDADSPEAQRLQIFSKQVQCTIKPPQTVAKGKELDIGLLKSLFQLSTPSRFC